MGLHTDAFLRHINLICVIHRAIIMYGREHDNGPPEFEAMEEHQSIYLENDEIRNLFQREIPLEDTFQNMCIYLHLTHLWNHRTKRAPFLLLLHDSSFVSLCGRNACCLSVFGCFWQTLVSSGGLCGGISIWLDALLSGRLSERALLHSIFINLNSLYPMECLHCKINNGRKVDPLNIQCLGL